MRTLLALLITFSVFASAEEISAYTILAKMGAKGACSPFFCAVEATDISCAKRQDASVYVCGSKTLSATLAQDFASYLYTTMNTLGAAESCDKGSCEVFVSKVTCTTDGKSETCWIE